MDLLSFLRVLRRHLVLVVLCVVVGGVLGAASALLKSEPPASTREYFEATQMLNVIRDQSGAPQSGFASLDQIAVFVVNGEVPRVVAESIDEEPGDLVDRVTVTSNDFLGTLGVNVIGVDEDEAKELAGKLGTELVTGLALQLKQRYDAETAALLQRKDQLRAQEVALDGQLFGLPPESAAADNLRAERDAVSDRYRLTASQYYEHLAEPAPSSPVELLDEPRAIQIDQAQYDALLAQGEAGDHLIKIDEDGNAPGIDSAGSGIGLDGPVPRGLAGMFLGLLIGIGIALLLDSLDRRIRTRGDLESALGVPVLAEVPAVDVRDETALQVLSYVAPFSQVAEAYRAVRSALLFELTVAGRFRGEQAAPADDRSTPHASVVMVVSAVAAEGKTTATANLAVAFAETGASVLAIGGDFRKPKLHRMFGIADTPGAVFDTGIPGVDMVTSVQVAEGATPAQVVDAQRRLVETMSSHYDVILVDTAPLLSTNDAIDLAPIADLIVVVAKHGVTKTHHARRAAEILARIRRPVGGAVFTATPADQDGYGAYYGDVTQRLSAGVPPRNAEAVERADDDPTPDDAVVDDVVLDGKRFVAMSPTASPAAANGTDHPEVGRVNGTPGVDEAPVNGAASVGQIQWRPDDEVPAG